MLERLKRCYSNGPLAGIFLLILIIFDMFFLKYVLHTNQHQHKRILNVIRPVSSIECALEFPVREYKANKEKYGDH